MTDERYTFEQARVRLEEIAVEVRKKDVSLEKSLDLLEEGVRLANICTELVDHTDLSASALAEEADTQLAGDTGRVPEAVGGETQGVVTDSDAAALSEDETAGPDAATESGEAMASDDDTEAFARG